MDLPDSNEEVLSQPTRARIFELLVEARGPVRTDDVARELGMHPNGVRRHLERLNEVGLIERRRQRGGRGRPGDRWVVAADASPAGKRPTAYAELAIWLAELVPNTPAAIRRAEEIGRRIGRSLAPAAGPAGGSLGEAFGDTFAALGFQPQLEEAEEGFTCRLDNCPYAASAAVNPKAICGLHRGMTEGLLEQIDPEARLTGFLPCDPHEAGCLVTIR